MALRTEPTTHYWQRVLPPGAPAAPPWQVAYPASLPDGRVLMLPIRALPAQPGEPPRAVASLLINHASMSVADLLATQLAKRIEPLAPQVVVGLPTLGLALAAALARELGHDRFVPLGTSRKFWYDDMLSAEVTSITSPGAAKRIYLDPHLLPLVEGVRAVLVDDAISTGATAAPAWTLLERVGARVVGYGVAMLQGQRWRAKLGPERAARVQGVFECPLLRGVAEGWVPDEG
jgi:adenine/guanine phosphoribosyltransferase-like PRPP-binding protein